MSGEGAGRDAPLRVGLIGYGAIGQGVARLLRERGDADLALVAALVRDAARPRPAPAPPVVATLEALLAARPEVVVEAGGHAALRAHGPGVLRAGCDLLLLSVGALAEPGVEEALVAAARAGGSRARVVSGAIGALDALAAAAVGGLTRVTHTARKPPLALLDPAEAARLTAPRELFRGSAREGALRFPESINVAAAVALAGLGLDRTEVRVIADPAVRRNEHEVEAEGAFGTLRFAISGVPSAENRRTGRLVAMSVVHALRRRRAPLAIG
ncbi:MAG TPA: aspartate dehydrogenase [Thermomicrobiales bacterium]|nr:aspartate dehydrogenase [Thermomicrobiales bacterium]